MRPGEHKKAARRATLTLPLASARGAFEELRRTDDAVCRRRLRAGGSDRVGAAFAVPSVRAAMHRVCPYLESHARGAWVVFIGVRCSLAFPESLLGCSTHRCPVVTRMRGLASVCVVFGSGGHGSPRHRGQDFVLESMPLFMPSVSFPMGNSSVFGSMNGCSSAITGSLVNR